MRTLYLEDFKGMKTQEVRSKIISDFSIPPFQLSQFHVLIAYMSVGDYGCDSSAYILLRDKKTKKLFNVHGSHCSCFGFEEQFTPESVTKKFLQSDKFYVSTGGYDSNGGGNRDAILKYLNEHL